MGPGSSVAVRHGVGHRRGSDSPVAWGWCRPAAAASIDSTPSLGTSICRWCVPKKKKKEKEKKKKKKAFVLLSW